MSSKYKTITKDDQRFITRGELRADLEKHAEIAVKIIRDSMTEVMQLLFLVLGEEAINEAMEKAARAQAVADANRQAQIEATGQSIAADMQRFDDQNRERPSLVQ